MSSISRKNRDLATIDKPLDLLRLFASQKGPWVLLASIIFLALAYQYLYQWQWLEVAFVFMFFILRGFVEWLIHAYIMHARPLPIFKIRLKNPIYTMHIHHHKFPDDLDGLFFKGRSVFLLLLVCFLFFYMLSIRISIMVTLCLAIGLLMYEVFHMLSHSKIQLKNRYLMALLMNHRNHHRLNATRFMGVSSLLADKFFKTLGR